MATRRLRAAPRSGSAALRAHKQSAARGANRAARPIDAAGETVTVACECGWLDCHEALEIPATDYTRVTRHEPHRFVAVAEHAEPSLLRERSTGFVLLAGWDAQE